MQSPIVKDIDSRLQSCSELFVRFLAFRDWATETTAYPNEWVEMAVAHTIKNKAEAAYMRGDLLEKRRRLMEDWARYCHTSKAIGEVTPHPKTV